MKPEQKNTYNADEELANSITHGIGFFMGIAVLVLLVVFSVQRKTAWEVVSCSIYGSTFILLYLASTLYHSARSPRIRAVFKVIDHSAIYLLIAGTYTPLTLVPLRGGLGWSLFGVVWGCALVGILFKIFFTGRFKAVSLISYLLMGWLCVGAIKPLFNELTPASFILLVAGGLCYSVGAIFYGWKSLPWSHAIWHLFVLAGSLCHFFSILYGVAL
jgi:hemolysin III